MWKSSLPKPASQIRGNRLRPRVIWTIVSPYQGRVACGQSSVLVFEWDGAPLTKIWNWHRLWTYARRLVTAERHVKVFKMGENRAVRILGVESPVRTPS